MSTRGRGRGTPRNPVLRLECCRFPGVPRLRRRRRGRWRRGVSDGARAGAKFGGFWGDPARFGASLRRTPPRHGRRRSVFPLAQRRVGRRGHFLPRRAALCRAGGHSKPSPGAAATEATDAGTAPPPPARPVGLRSGSRFVRAAGREIGARIRNIVKAFRGPPRVGLARPVDRRLGDRRLADRRLGSLSGGAARRPGPVPLPVRQGALCCPATTLLNFIDECRDRDSVKRIASKIEGVRALDFKMFRVCLIRLS